MIISSGVDGARISLSTKVLEPKPGDMLTNPGLVFEKAEEMAALFRERTQVWALALSLLQLGSQGGRGWWGCV